jgi:nucleoside-diphosphate-sugar epimerase
MNYIITGGTGFIGTHLTNLILTEHPEAKVWNLDIVKPGTPNPVVKNYKPAVREGETLGSIWVECDVRKPIGNLPFTPTPEDVIFNFAAVHRTPGHEDIEYFETNIRGAENVCAFAENYGIKNMVFTSSIAPYGAMLDVNTIVLMPYFSAKAHTCSAPRMFVSKYSISSCPGVRCTAAKLKITSSGVGVKGRFSIGFLTSHSTHVDPSVSPSRTAGL